MFKGFLCTLPFELSRSSAKHTGRCRPIYSRTLSSRSVLHSYANSRGQARRNTRTSSSGELKGFFFYEKSLFVLLIRPRIEMATNPHQELESFHSCSNGQSVYCACTLEVACHQRSIVSLHHVTRNQHLY